jgi:hypothetical protein
LRVVACCAAAFLANAIPAVAQIEEPILLKSAEPFPVGAGSVKLDYSQEQSRSGATAETIPEITVEAGALPRTEVILRYPLVRFTPVHDGPAEIGGGQIAMGARFLLAGGPEENHAVSVQAVVEAPTGDSRLVGNAAQVMPELLADWHLSRNLTVYTNAFWDVGWGGSGRRVSFLAYQAASALPSLYRFVPVLEFAASTNTSTGRTLAVLQPDLLVHGGHHLEFKLGVPFGLNANTAGIGFRAQLAIFWGYGNRN